MAEQQEIVYLFGYSPRQGTQLENLLSILSLQASKAKVSVVLIHDGVIGLNKNGKIPSSLGKLLDLPLAGVLAVAPDMKARGIPTSAVVDGVKVIEYPDLADLMAGNAKIMSWM
ncbi:MAG: sulfurtransferase complex subunit TusB [Promethearchaeota archaeon]